MKRMLAAMLTALMLLTFIPLASPPAEAALAPIGIIFNINCSVNYGYVGESVEWRIDVSGGSGNYQYALDIYKDGQLLSEDWMLHDENNRYYVLPSPGKYMVQAWVRDTVNNQSYSKFSSEITVKARVNKITKVEPLGPSSLRITWNKVPGATEYHLFCSTDMKNWNWVKTTTGTSLTNTNLKAGTRYFYRISYERLGVMGCDLGPAAAGVPMAKTRITSLTSPLGKQIKMTWAKAAGASGYQVAMATSANGSYKSVRTVTGGTAAIFSGVKSGSTLFFKVRPYRRVYTTTYWGPYTAPRAVKVK